LPEALTSAKCSAPRQGAAGAPLLAKTEFGRAAFFTAAEFEVRRLSHGHLTGLVAADCHKTQERLEAYSPRRWEQSLTDAVNTKRWTHRSSTHSPRH
jgi:hypothetical protein